MAAPATTARLTPAGIYLDDGYQTLIATAADTNVSFWEKTVQPPGLDGGDAIDTTNMHNTVWRTMRARALKTLTEFTVLAGWDPDVYNNIIDNLLNVESDYTVNFPDGSTLDFFAYMRVFAPAELAEGVQPEATITFQPTNYDPTNDVEASPVLTSVAGT
jgi:hypothetical protein